MSDEPIEQNETIVQPIFPQLPMTVALFMGDAEAMAQLDRSCAAALKNQLNINRNNPVLAALEVKWKTMDAFSKRELGDAPTKSTDITQTQRPSVAAQIVQGQTATVIGPSTIYGGDVTIKQGET